MKVKRTFLFVASAVLFVGACLAIARGVWVFLPQNPVPEGVPTARPEGGDWVDLLDDAHVAGWKNITDGKEIFEILDSRLRGNDDDDKDRTVHLFGRSLHPLRYVGYVPESFGNFDLHLEFKLAHHTNSGVFLRSKPNDPVARGFEIQVLEDFGRPPDKNSCGAIYDVVTPMFNLSRPAGEWNSFDVSVQGQEVIVRMNGWLIIHTDFAKMVKPLGKFTIAYADLPLDGALALQDHGGEAWYRNIVIHKR